MVEGLIEISGEKWQQRRLFIHGVFRGFGIGTGEFEIKILEECNYMMPMLLHEGQSGPYDPIWFIMVSTIREISIKYSVKCNYIELVTWHW